MELERMGAFFDSRLNDYEAHQLNCIASARAFYPYTASLLPEAPVGYWLGLKLLKHLPRAPFNQVIAVAMLLTGLKLLADAWSG